MSDSASAGNALSLKMCEEDYSEGDCFIAALVGEDGEIKSAFTREMLFRQKFTIRVRRDFVRPVKPEVEPVDGGSYWFTFGWTQGDCDPYPGEGAFIADDPAYPSFAPRWISSGDLVRLSEPG